VFDDDIFPAVEGMISIHGAREHNLKNLTLTIPRNKFVVVTGVSGSGKSTLAFDLLFAEGQRRFLDSMNVYARQFVEQLSRPDVDLITGIPPTVSIEQRNSRGGGKSTVATVTEIYHFIRLLFARLGTQYCPDCQLPVEAQTRDALGARLKAEMKKRGDLLLLAPVVRNRKGFHTDVAEWAARHGYAEVRADGRIHQTSGALRLDRFREHDVEIVVGVLEKKHRQISKPPQELIDETLKLGHGTMGRYPCIRRNGPARNAGGLLNRLIRRCSATTRRKAGVQSAGGLGNYFIYRRWTEARARTRLRNRGSNGRKETGRFVRIAMVRGSTRWCGPCDW
jgi:excinuclease ABC subunit A